MKNIGAGLVAFAVLVAPGTRGLGQSQTPLVPSIEGLMSVQQFRAAGLHKLSGDELAAMNEWLTEYTLSVAQLVEQSAAGTAATSGNVIESRIDGEFTGWEGETIFKLQNGQIWQQSSYNYMYKYIYNPDVVIYRSGSGYKMRVDRVDREIAVRRLK